MNSKKISRRNLFKVSAIAGGGLMLKLSLPANALEDGATTLVKSSELNFYVQIASDGQITIYAPNPEMGQGIKTTLPMIIAEEMGANWDDVEVVLAPIDPAKFGLQGSGGSMSVTRNFDAMRRMGASAREMLIGAASQLMEVERRDLKAESSQVIHGSGRSMTFGQLASVAAQQPVPVPEQLSFKDPRSYSIIGTSVGSVDNLVIATGLSKFGIDVDVPGMKFASYTRCPRPGGKAISFNRAEIKALPGVVDAFILQPDVRSGKASMAFLEGLAELQGGVAIVGDDTWSVFAAKAKLKVNWDESAASTDQWSKMVTDARAIAAKGGGEVKLVGASVPEALSDSNNRTIEGFYEFPYVAHVCMEPMNCTVDFRKGTAGKPASMEIWLGSQFPNQVKEIAENMLGVKQENVKVHGLRMGGGFGRRAVHDFAAEAMAISHKSGLPVKLTWTRTDDIHNDYFRVGGFENMKGAVNPDGKLAAWDQHYIGFADSGKPVIGSGLRGNELPMVAFDNASVRQSMMPVATACGAWRAPGSNTNAFVEQSFIHELANLAERDHVEFLTELMGSRRWIDEGNISALNTGRAIDVIKLAAEKAGWGRKMPEGTGLGLAFYFCHAAHVAEVAEVSVDADKNYRVKRVTVAVDVGPIINMSGAINQVQGSIVDGLSTMALQEITMQNGRIEQDNFHQYPVMRIASTPEIDVHFIQSDNKPTGLGEPALPPLAPAVTNAIFAATGERIRSMPLSNAGFKLV
ncbi:molybdopterin-dependent oxidoreductase [Pseudomonadales bacterium]|nr:molybdopterin-dependent oxidoreductase [Pseudomonadales bacterium]MDB2596365.1 molybdopterin-dependent oxidoreductase [Pseudomonadales bacterium]